MDYNRWIIRSTLLTGAWCCGFVLCLLCGASPAQWGLATYISTALSSCADTLQERISTSALTPEALQQVLAITLGRREGLSEQLLATYRNAGASHVLALSGMHLGVLYGMLITLLRPSLYGRWRIPAHALILVTIWSYALMTGAPGSLVRAAMMASVMLWGHMSQLKVHHLDVLTAAVALVFVLDPGALFDVGFQLSCAAMLGIILVALPVCREVRSKVVHLLCISIAAQAFTLPLTVWYFRYVSPWSVLSSLIVVPLTTIIIHLSLLLYLFPTLTPLAWAVELLLWMQNTVLTSPISS